MGETLLYEQYTLMGVGPDGEEWILNLGFSSIEEAAEHRDNSWFAMQSSARVVHMKVYGLEEDDD